MTAASPLAADPAAPAPFDPARALKLARETLDIEAAAVLGLKDRVGPAFASFLPRSRGAGGMTESGYSVCARQAP